MSADATQSSSNIGVVANPAVPNRRAFFLRSLLAPLALIVVLAVALLPFALRVDAAQRAERALEAAQHTPGRPELIGVAVTLLEQARERVPDDVITLRQLAAAYQLAGRHPDALGALQAAYRLQPDSLLVQQELAHAYARAGDATRAAALWSAFQVPTTQEMLAFGDASLDRGQAAEALAWYDSTLSFDPDLRDSPSMYFRRALAAVFATSPRAPQLIQAVQASDPTFTVPLVDAEIVIPGGQMRWATQISDDVSYGTPLSYPDGRAAAAFWWEGHGVALVQVAQSQRYYVTFQVRHLAPGGVRMAFGADGRQRREVLLSRADNSVETCTFYLDLAPGFHTIDAWFLGSNTIDTIDRDATVEWLQVTQSTGQ